MTGKIPQNVTHAIRNRRGLLWVIQRYDLNPNEEPHPSDLPENEAAVRYRSTPDDTDRGLASLYWEAAWFEGAISPVLKAMRENADSQLSKNRRAVVVLAGTADAAARVPTGEFLPAAVLPGLIDSTAPMDARYGNLRPRVRDRLAWDLASRMAEYNDRVLVVTGAKVQKDLEFLSQVIEDSKSRELELLVTWPEREPQPDIPVRPGISVSFWFGSVTALLDELRTVAAAPKAGEIPRRGIRVGRKTVSLSARELDRIEKRFALLTEEYLIPANSFALTNLENFLAGSLDDWTAYSVGLPVPRDYRTDQGQTLEQELQSAFHEIQKRDADTLTFTIQLPAVGGSGTTTMLRAAAFKAASEGFPALLLKPNQVEIDLEELLAFATALSEASLASEIEHVPPLLVVADCEHEAIASIKQLPQVLAASGRRLVLLQAIRHDPAVAAKERRVKRVIRLKPLLAQTTDNEVLQCQAVFDRIARQWNLPVQIPSAEEWKNYEQSSKRLTPTGLDSFLSLFWVALRFFLTRDIELTLQDQLQEKLGSWIEKRASQVSDTRMQAVVTYTAAFSSLRMISPMWTVLRPVTGGSFPSTFVTTLQQLRDVITWGDMSEDLGDQTLWFLHPSVADEYLRRRGIRRPEQKIQALTPVLKSLSAGHPGDVWVAETLAAEVFAPRFQERKFLDWDWRLEGFEHIPPVLREQSKTILHHWARCLYLSAEKTPGQLLSQAQRKDRIERSIEKLVKATSLPKRPGRDEHPSHLFNTLGTAYARYAQFLQENEAPEDQVSDAWNDARKAFKNSIDLLGGTNVEALLAFTDRLLSHADTERVHDSESADTADDVAEALSLIDRAEDVLEDYANPDPDWQENLTRYRAQAMNWLRSGTGLEYLRSLQARGDSDLGYY